jgi:hypothetical protein
VPVGTSPGSDTVAMPDVPPPLLLAKIRNEDPSTVPSMIQ